MHRVTDGPFAQTREQLGGYSIINANDLDEAIGIAALSGEHRKENRIVLSKAKTVDQYLAELSPDRRQAINAVRTVILKNLPAGFEEVMQYGMISYVVPLELFPAGYHCDPNQPLCFAGLASQKNHMAIYLMTIYGHKETEKWFVKEYKASGKKLDMGKSCVRFKKLEDLPLDVIGQAIARVPVNAYIKAYENSRSKAKK